MSLTNTESIVSKIWAEVLSRPDVPPDANFFELGGSSLQATRIVVQVEDTFSVQIQISLLAERPTIRFMAELVEQQRAEPSLTVSSSTLATEREHGAI